MTVAELATDSRRRVAGSNRHPPPARYYSFKLVNASNSNSVQYPSSSPYIITHPAAEPPSIIVAYQDVTLEASIPSAPTSSSAVLSANYPDDDLSIRPEVEESFCSNFVCCGQCLADLHALLQHYEDCHVRFEGGSSGTTGMTGDHPMFLPHEHYVPNFHHGAHHHAMAGVGRNSPHSGKRKRMLAVESEQCDFLTDDTNVVSAFDNTILRTITPLESTLAVPYAYNFMKRPQSVPAAINFSRLPSLPGQPSESPIDQYRFIHSILSATIDSPDSTDSDQFASTGANGHPVSNHQQTAPNADKQQLHSAAYTTVHAAHVQQDLSELILYSDDKAERPYVCKIPGCGKSYKNPNGLKYHEKHGHDEDAEAVERPHKCAVAGCGKKYKNSNGLKYHMAHAHPNYVRHLGGGMPSFSAPRYPHQPLQAPPQPQPHQQHHYQQQQQQQTTTSIGTSIGK